MWNSLTKYSLPPAEVACRAGFVADFVAGPFRSANSLQNSICLSAECLLKLRPQQSQRTMSAAKPPVWEEVIVEEAVLGGGGRGAPVFSAISTCFDALTT